MTPRFTAPTSGPQVHVSKVEATGQRFARFHDCYRFYREKGLGQIDALATARQYHPELNKAYCQAQERRESWALEPLDAKTYTALQLQGKLT